MALNDRKGGMTANIRVSPKDCLAVLDVMKAIDLDPYAHSFAGCVSLTLTTLIALARQQKVIPEEEDGFQYLNRMQPFFGQHSTRVKRERTNALYENAVRGGSIPQLTKPMVQAPIETPVERWKIHPDLFEEYQKLDELFPNLDEEMKARRIELRNFLQLH